jgi:hypothetical protein
LAAKDKAGPLYVVQTAGLTPDVVTLARRIGNLDRYWRAAVEAILAIGESVPSEAADARRKAALSLVLSRK